MKLSAVIFDMDGTMLDTERTYREVFNRAAADCAIEFPESLHFELLGRNTQDTKKILGEKWNDAAQLEQFFDRCRHHHVECFEKTPLELKSGLLDLLDYLESRNVPKIVATSTRRSHAIPRLTKVNLLHRFLTITTGDQVQHGKPAPDLFLLAAGTIDARPDECLVLEDSEAGVRGAHAAGMNVFMIPDMKPPCDATRACASAVCASLHEVTERLRLLPLPGTPGRG
jgi:HAD superfamily hydrolase (TIGR01509 family)